MLLYLALKGISPGSSQCATRPGGPTVTVNRHMSVKVFRKKGSLGDWRPCFGDFVAEDWYLFDVEEQLRAMELANGSGEAVHGGPRRLGE